MASVALVTHVPEQLLAFRRWKRLSKGFYQLWHGFLVSLVAINELPIRREYYPVVCLVLINCFCSKSIDEHKAHKLLLASGKQRERFLRAIL